MKYSKRSYRPRRKIVRRRKATKKGPFRGRKFNTAVKRVIHRMAENKNVISSAANQTIQPCDGVTAVPYKLNLLPPIAQGTSQAQRIGDSVRIVGNTINAYINLLPWNATTNPYSCPIIVKMWVVSWKYANVGYTEPALTDFNNFFELGSNSTNFIGNPLDMLRAVNKDVFTVHTTKQFELSCAPGWNASITNAIYPNLSGVMSKKVTFNVGKYVKSLKFNDAATDYATNHNLYLITQTVKADGTAVAASDRYCEFHFVQKMTYEDI